MNDYGVRRILLGNYVEDDSYCSSKQDMTNTYDLYTLTSIYVGYSGVFPALETAQLTIAIPLVLSDEVSE